MSDLATPNLPARDMAATSAFYQKLGFEEDYVSSDWMILSRGSLLLEFFLYSDLNPAESAFGSCWRVDDMHSLYDACLAAQIPVANTGIPRIQAPKVETSGLTIAYLVDLDGSLIRIIQND